jgi:hypothetical protein
MTPRRVGTALAVLVYLLAETASAEPAPSVRLRMRDDSTLTLKSGRVLELPPGRFIEETEFERMEAEHRRLQEAETRLTAERNSYKKSNDEWRLGWKSLVFAFALGSAYATYVLK